MSLGKKHIGTILFFLCILTSCSKTDADNLQVNDIPVAQKTQATFAGGCFWCMEKPFESYDGIYSVISGYSGGEIKNPSYKQVASGSTTHIESVQVTYNPMKISYGDLLQIFWRNIDATDPSGQFYDRGHQYTTAIFYHNQEQKKAAEIAKDNLEKSHRFPREIATVIQKYSVFYQAEEYHQDFYKKSPMRYHSYRIGSGRDAYIEKIWGKNKQWKVKNQRNQ